MPSPTRAIDFGQCRRGRVRPERLNASFTNLTTGASTNSITTTGAGSGTDTLTISNLTAASGALFTDNGTRKLALSINGTPTLDPLTNASNTFSGGLSLLNMRLGVVDNSATTGGRYGKGTITIGTGSQLYFNAANKTISNDIVVNANSNVGSRTGAFRVDTAGHTLSGTITAGAADAMFNAGGGNGGLTVHRKNHGHQRSKCAQYQRHVDDVDSEQRLRQ